MRAVIAVARQPVGPVDKDERYWTGRGWSKDVGKAKSFPSADAASKFVGERPERYVITAYLVDGPDLFFAGGAA